MAAIDNQIHPPQPGKPKNTTQVMSMLVGFILCVIGAAGLLYPSFAGLHISILYGLILFAAGASLIRNGYYNDSWRSFQVCTAFGIFFGTLSIMGFVLGAPGEPSVGYLRTDPLLVKIIPGFQELGKSDHVLNGVIALLLLGGALDWFQVRRKGLAQSYSPPAKPKTLRPIRH